MHRWLSLICGLAFVLCSWTTSTAYAAQVSCNPAETEVLGHFDGGRDEIPPSKEGGVAHHHSGCSGHHAPAPSNSSKFFVQRVIENVAVHVDDQRADSRSPEIQLRPPIA